MYHGQVVEGGGGGGGNFLGHENFFPPVGCALDLPQVDLVNFREEYVRPRSGHCLGHEKADQATKSLERKS